MKNNKLLYDTYEKPPLSKWIILSLQHVFAMFGATVLVPILVNQQAGMEVLSIPVALVTSGIGTIIYLLCTKGRSPVYLGSSFAFIGPIATAAINGGKTSFISGIIAVGLLYCLFSLLVKIFGKNWINKLLPPVVVGPMIMVIGLGFASSAVANAGLVSGGTWKPILIALFTFFITAYVALRGKGFFRVIPFLIGIVSGYILAIVLGEVNFSGIAEASFFSVPNLLIPFKDYKFSLIGFLSIFPIAFVTVAEHIGDHMALSKIIDKDLITDPGLERTLLGDGLATTVAGLLGGPANTTYGENTSVVGMSKVASVWVIGLAAIMAIIISFLGKITAVINTVPSSVLGGVSLLLYGFIAVNGLKVIVNNKIDFEDIRNVIITSIMLVLGLGGAVITISTGNVSIGISGMSLAALVGIILNLILPKSSD